MIFELEPLQQIIGGIAVLLGIFGYALYIRGILRNEVKPHFFSWFVWAILATIASVAQVLEGGGPGAWVTIATAVMSFVFAFVGLGASSRILIAKSDWFSFVGAVLAIPVWYVTGNPLWSVIMITIIDAVAFIPTFRKAYVHPATENISSYALAGIKFLFGVFALSSITLTTALYPASIVLADAIFVGMLLWRRRQLKKQNT